ncbi:hypothetical protein QQ73_04570, partial [Candidatus Endoriftia persephone str. Guaymas]|nr:hypothetical protein [Candidatus Endoriftia persephone str. Guaymas]
GRLFTGPSHSQMQEIEDLRPTELAAASMLSLGILLLGIFPAPALQLVSASVEQLSGLFAGHF